MKPDEIKKEIEKLALAEQILLVEELWDAIAAHAGSVPMPEWHKEELERRYEEFQRGEQTLHDWQGTHEALRGKYLPAHTCVDLERQARALPPDQRAQLAEAPLAETEAAWECEIAARAAAYDRGELQTYPAEEVFAELRRMVR